MVVAGGFTDRGVQTGWVSLPDMPVAAWGAMACVLDGWLYVAGGSDGGSYGRDRMQTWNGPRWELKANLPEARVGAACVATTNGKIMLIGGKIGRLSGAFGTSSVNLHDPMMGRRRTSPGASLRL